MHGLGGAGRAPGLSMVPGSSRAQEPQPRLGTGCPILQPHSPRVRHHCPTHHSSVLTPEQPSPSSRHTLPAQRGSRAAVSQAVCYRKEQRAAISFQNVICLRRAASLRLPAASSVTAVCVVPTEGVGPARPLCSAPHFSPVPEPGTASASSRSVGLSPPEPPQVVSSWGWDPRDRCRNSAWGKTGRTHLHPPALLTPLHTQSTGAEPAPGTLGCW